MIFADPAPAKDPDLLSACAGTWWFAVVRPRFEGRLCSDLEQAGIAAVAPTVPVIRTETDRDGRMHRRTIRLPLFPGYVFLNGDAEARYAARQSLATLTVRDISDQRRFARELGAILTAEAAGMLTGACRFKEGMAVNIVAGPLRGWKGIVESIGARIVYLRCKTIGAACGVEVPSEYVEAV